MSTQTIFLFVLFGAILEKAGAGAYFIKIAFALLGHLRGGPAKAAVIASAMSGGRYSDASPIVLLLLALLCVELHGTVLVDLANVSEANRSKLISSLVPSLFLIPAIFTVEKGGVTVLLGL